MLFLGFKVTSALYLERCYLNQLEMLGGVAKIQFLLLLKNKKIKINK